MSGLAAHAVHYGLLVAGLVALALVLWSARRGRHGDQAGDEHDLRVEALRAAAREGTLGRPQVPPADARRPGQGPDD